MKKLLILIFLLIPLLAKADGFDTLKALDSCKTFTQGTNNLFYGILSCRNVGNRTDTIKCFFITPKVGTAQLVYLTNLTTGLSDSVGIIRTNEQGIFGIGIPRPMKIKVRWTNTKWDASQREIIEFILKEN